MSFQQQYLPRYQWANPYLFFPIPDTVITVDGTQLPIVARHRPYADEAEVLATVPAIARVEGALVAISDGGDGYNFYYWFINRTFAPFGCIWELKPLVPVSDTYELAFRVYGSGTNSTGPATHFFSIPFDHRIVKIDVYTGFSGQIAGHGIGTQPWVNDIAEFTENMNRGTMDLSYIVNVSNTGDLYYNAPYVDIDHRVIVTIRKNPFDKYPNL
ncbi:hypothetical protein [Phnomibacter sp. MR]|uniref:hypothetical protein n=1 Tax=Phnomibacter sp. MR TaxID=3042318 RepID=UPI003A811743